jgi:hypothetical protein
MVADDREVNPEGAIEICISHLVCESHHCRVVNGAGVVAETFQVAAMHGGNRKVSVLGVVHVIFDCSVRCAAWRQAAGGSGSMLVLII